MHLIDVHGIVFRNSQPPLLHPLTICPFKAAYVKDDRRRPGAQLAAGGVRVCLDPQGVLLRTDFKFVLLSLPDAGNKELPHSGHPHAAQGIDSSVEVVEISDKRDTLGIGSPNGKFRPGASLM